MFTNEEKWQAAAREVRLRRRVYPSLVASGQMSQQEADSEIALMKEIANDYRARRTED